MRDHGTGQRNRFPSRRANGHVNQEPTRYAENARAMTQIFNKFWSRRSEAAWPISAAPNPIMIPLDLAGLRRGLARLFVP